MEIKDLKTQDTNVYTIVENKETGLVYIYNNIDSNDFIDNSDYLPRFLKTCKSITDNTCKYAFVTQEEN